MSRKTIDLEQIPDQDIIKSFYLSQGLLLVIGCIAYYIFYKDMPPLTNWYKGHTMTIVFLGFGSGLILALFELGIDRMVPKSWFDDGGINRRVFQAFSPGHILFAMLVVAFVEEGLFRGVIQNTFGLMIASLLFGLVHVRYIKKPLMMLVALGIGFYLGWLYLLTDSLLVPIAAHYTIDVILGFVLKKQSRAQV